MIKPNQNSLCPFRSGPRTPPKLFYVMESAPCRGVLLAASLIGVRLELEWVDLRSEDDKRQKLGGKNPAGQVPTLDDNGYYLSESRAIIMYLANEYMGSDDSLYPRDAKKRGLVDRMLFFDMGTLFKSFADYYLPFMFAGAIPTQRKLDDVKKAFAVFDKMLAGSDYAAGDAITIADAALAATVSTIEVVEVLKIENYPNVWAWYGRCKEALPDYERANPAVEFEKFAIALITEPSTRQLFAALSGRFKVMSWTMRMNKNPQLQLAETLALPIFSSMADVTAGRPVPLFPATRASPPPG
ncbi:glutathione S-transferase 1-1-like isoform X2 [Bemisia tabaci]|uniref:Glutathione S-transferase d5 n=1 Tax=Bemisia tabaci TaxID=7038 RepID=A0A223FQY8_BEMTA|nr:glutathione S-transferase d5 [Bemisia tabaci]AST11621.1 glutathione S-transferase d5 [Bemisia tabaci]